MFGKIRACVCHQATPTINWFENSSGAATGADQNLFESVKKVTEYMSGLVVYVKPISVLNPFKRFGMIFKFQLSALHLNFQLSRFQLFVHFLLQYRKSLVLPNSIK